VRWLSTGIHRFPVLSSCNSFTNQIFGVVCGRWVAGVSHVAAALLGRFKVTRIKQSESAQDRLAAAERLAAQCKSCNHAKRRLVRAWGAGMFAADGIINWSQVSAYLGILAVGACLLMIAGEFDLSLGSMIGFAGMLMAIPAVYYHVPLWASILLAFAGSMALGALNGWIEEVGDGKLGALRDRFRLWAKPSWRVKPNTSANKHAQARNQLEATKRRKPQS